MVVSKKKKKELSSSSTDPLFGGKIVETQIWNTIIPVAFAKVYVLALSYFQQIIIIIFNNSSIMIALVKTIPFVKIYLSCVYNLWIYKCALIIWWLSIYSYNWG